VISSRDGACDSPAISTVVSGAIDAWICQLSTYHLRVRRSANRSLRPMTCVSTLLCISVLVSSSSAQSGVWCIFERSDFCSCEVLFSSLERRLWLCQIPSVSEGRYSSPQRSNPDTTDVVTSGMRIVRRRA
jgi:hypothetical protein